MVHCTFNTVQMQQPVLVLKSNIYSRWLIFFQSGALRQPKNDFFETFVLSLDFNVGLKASKYAQPDRLIPHLSSSTFWIIQISRSRLCHNKQSKVYLPEPPFPHAEVSPAAVSPASEEQRCIPDGCIKSWLSASKWALKWPCKLVKSLQKVSETIYS